MKTQYKIIVGVIIFVVAIIIFIKLNDGVENIIKTNEFKETISLKKNENSTFINGEKIFLSSSKDYNILIKRAIENKQDYLLRDILNEEQYQYIKNAYFEKIDKKLLEFHTQKLDIKSQVQEAIKQSKQDMKTGQFTKKEYKAWLLDIKKQEASKLQIIKDNENYFKIKKPHLERFEIVNLINDYYTNNINVDTKNNPNIRSLTLSQISPSHKAVSSYYKVILRNVNNALKSTKTITLKDLFPKYKLELKTITDLNNQLKKVKYNKAGAIQYKITGIKLNGLIGL